MIQIIRNWLFWIILSSSVLVLGAIIERMTDWPYISYLGYIMFGGIIVLWSLIALIAWIKTLI